MTTRSVNRSESQEEDAYRRILAASGASAVGDGVRDVALPLLAFAVLRDPFQVAVVAAANRLPWLLFSLPGGVYADRLDRRKAMVWADLLRAGALGVLIALWAAGPLALWSLTAVTLVLGSCSVLSQCAAFAVIPDVVPNARLEAANGRLMSMQTAGRELLGRATGGLLFAVSRPVPFLFDALSFAVSALIIGRTHTPASPPSDRRRSLQRHRRRFPLLSP